MCDSGYYDHLVDQPVGGQQTSEEKPQADHVESK